MLQIVASLTSLIDDTSQGYARANETFMVQASLTIVTYNRQNIFCSTGQSYITQAWLKPIEIKKSVLSQKFLFSLNTRPFPFADR